MFMSQHCPLVSKDFRRKMGKKTATGFSRRPENRSD